MSDDNITTIGFEPATDQAGLNQCLNQGEAGYGRLISIGIRTDNTATAASFRYEPGQAKPLSLFVKGQVPAGTDTTHEKVCEGKAFVSGQRKDVIVYRLK